MKLTCNETGDFTILVIGDPQLDWPEVYHEGPEEIDILLDRVNPDFVLLNGDLKTRNDYDFEYLDGIVSPINKRNIPWAYTNGNHDPFSEEHHAWYKSYPLCLGDVVSPDAPDFEPTRPLNYVLPVYSHDGTRQVFAVWGMDTGAYNEYGWDGLTEKQIRWYRRTSDEQTARNGKKVAGLLCCHIAFTQVLDLYYSKKSGKTAVLGERGDAYPCYGNFTMGIEAEDYNCEEYITDTGTVLKGRGGSSCTRPQNDRGMMQAILDQGDIKAVAFAHEHIKNMAGSFHGVLLSYSGKISMGCGADEQTRGGRVFRFNEKNPEGLVTWWVGSMETSEDQPVMDVDGNLKRTLDF